MRYLWFVATLLVAVTMWSSKALSQSLVEFAFDAENELDSKVITFLRGRTTNLINRSEIGGFSVVPCGASASSSLHVCMSPDEELRSIHPTLDYSISSASYAFLVGNMLRPSASVVYVSNEPDDVFQYLLSRGFSVTHVGVSEIDRLTNKRQRLYLSDALVFGKSSGISSSQRAQVISFYRDFNIAIISHTTSDLELGATHAVMSTAESILKAFVGILRFYNETGILRSAYSPCVGEVVENPESNNQLAVKSNSAAIKQAIVDLQAACGE